MAGQTYKSAVDIIKNLVTGLALPEDTSGILQPEGAMKPLTHLVFWLLLVTIGSGREVAAEADASGCVAPSFTFDIKSTLESCTDLLKDEKLSDADRAKILTLRGRSLKIDKQFDAAIRDFDAALVLKPDESKILEMRAWAAVDTRDFETADRIVERLLSLDADDATAFNIGGTAAFSKGIYGAAKRLYDKAISLRPNYVLARYNRLILYKLTGFHRAVVAEADALLALDNPDLDTLYATLENKRMTYRTKTRLERVLIWETMGLTEEAEKAFADWIAVEPSAVSYGYRATFHQRRSHHEQALADLDKALADDPTFWLLHHTQGRVYLYTSRNEDAIRSFTRAIELNPAAGVSYWARAMAERRQNRGDAALRDALKAVAIDKGVRLDKITKLSNLGYLQIGPNDINNPIPALADAVQACMYDERCW